MNRKEKNGVKEKNRWFNWKKGMIILVMLILLASIAAGFFLNGGHTIRDIFTNKSLLENTYYLVQTIAAAAVIIGAIIGVWQYVLTARCERAKISKESIQRAIDLAEYYKDHILPELAKLKYIFERSGIDKVLGSIKADDMVEFDKSELEKNLTKIQLDQISEIMYSDEMKKILIDAENLYGDKKGARGSRELMSSTVNYVLNNMEYFAMNFTHETADESVVYQSLHQTYTTFVQLLYYNIAINNAANGQQYYRNVIALYKTWYNKSQRTKAEIFENARRSIDLGAKADRLL